MIIGLALQICLQSFITSYRKENGMKPNVSKSSEMVDPRSTGVLPNQRINISLNEDEIWTLIDVCNLTTKNLNLDKIENNNKKSDIQLHQISLMKNKLYEAQDSLWEIKEIKTRKNSLLGSYELNRKPNPILIDGEF